MARHRQQHVGEAAGDVRADRLALEGAGRSRGSTGRSIETVK